MTGPVTRRPKPWIVVALTTLALACVIAACEPTTQLRPIGPPSPVARASESPSPSPTARPPLPSSPLELPPSSPDPVFEQPPPPPPRWEAASTTFKTRLKAVKRLSKLRAAGFSGYKIKKVKTRFEVEREFATRAQAAAEVRRLARAGFNAHVQLST